MKKIIILSALLFLVGFYQFSRVIQSGGMKQLDFDTTVRIQNRIPARFDELWEDLAFFVTPVPSVMLVGLLTIAALFDVKNKKIRLRALFIPVLFGLMIMGEVYGKSVVHHPAPPFFMIKNPTTIFPKYYVNEQYSYPSGHTARAVFFGIITHSLFIIRYSLFKRKKLHVLITVGIIIYILMVAIGRIYLGHHWLSDIIGGGLLGGGLGLMQIGFLYDKDRMGHFRTEIEG